MGKETSYVGKAGHLAVMGEFALRGYNVAMPEIDVGDDLFVFNDATGSTWRIQVKTAIATARAKSDSMQFRIRESAITTRLDPDLHFIFACRLKDQWKFIIVSRSILENYVRAHSLGSKILLKESSGDRFTFLSRTLEKLNALDKTSLT